MSSLPDKRHTQIKLETLRGLKPFSHSAGLHDRHVGQERTHGNRPVVDRGAVTLAATKRARSPHRDTVDPETALKKFKLPDALKSKPESPWESYEKNYELRLDVGDRITVAERKDCSSTIVTVRSFPAYDAEEKLRMLQRIQHENFVSVLEVFSFDESFHIIFEHMPISLSHFAGILYYPNELQLASIIGQILNGLSYLSSEGLEHGALSCSNILVSVGGDVKIANQECCRDRPFGNGEPRDVRALSFITMELMQKYAKDDGAVGVDDLHRWPSDSRAVGFLSETTSATSVGGLMKHPLLGLPWRKEKLKGMVDFTLVSAFRGYKYPPGHLCPAILLRSLKIHAVFIQSRFPSLFYNLSLNLYMEITQIYARAAGDIFLILILINLRSYIVQLLRTVSLLMSKHLIYPQLLHRHQFLGPWSRADVLLQLIYITVNAFCVSFRVASVRMAGLRAANLSLINLIPLFFGPHLSFLADLLGVSLGTYRRIHRSAGMMSGFLLIVHVATVVANRAPPSFRRPENLWAVIGGSSIYLLLILSHPLLRKPTYEVSIRMHQALAALSAYAIWRHLALQPLLARRYIYVFAITFLSTLLLQSGFVIYRNGAVRVGYSGASITHVKDILKLRFILSRASITHDNDIVKIRLILSRPLKVEAGQYIGLWIPTVSFWSFLQIHPFVVTSWSEGKQNSLDLLIEPREGLTQELLRHSKTYRGGSSSCLALFSGPHGISAPVGDYETILMAASGFGIAAQLPYLKQLMYGYNSCKNRTRRVHLIWQLPTLDIGIEVESLLNDALVDDTLDEGYILSISIYIESGKADKVPFGRRATVYKGSADFEAILQEEAAGKYIKRVQEETAKREDMLVMVSGNDRVRDRLRDLVRGYLDRKVDLLELDYQPVEQ